MSNTKNLDTMATYFELYKEGTFLQFMQEHEYISIHQENSF